MSWKPETYKASKIDEMIKDQIIVSVVQNGLSHKEQV